MVNTTLSPCHLLSSNFICFCGRFIIIVRRCYGKRFVSSRLLSQSDSNSRYTHLGPSTNTMEKLRNLTSRLPTLSSSSPSAKLSKAFKFNSDHNVLRRTQPVSSGNPFNDGPTFEQVRIRNSQSSQMLKRGIAFDIEDAYDDTHGRSMLLSLIWYVRLILNVRCSSHFWRYVQ